jgi:hypothetical protein
MLHRSRLLTVQSYTFVICLSSIIPETEIIDQSSGSRILQHNISDFLGSLSYRWWGRNRRISRDSDHPHCFVSWIQVKDTKLDIMNLGE